MAQKFIAGEFVEAAQKATGLQHFDSESFREGLDVLLSDASKVDYPGTGIGRLRGALIGALSTRLKTTAYLEQRPELRKRPIERPVFEFGIPRTGTTLLRNLLAADPARRSPLTWEIDDPVPPPTQNTLYTDPRALYKSLGDVFTPEAESRMRAWLADNPQDQFGKHEYQLAQFGLTPEKVRGMFERYLSKYEVESEGVIA